MMLFKRLFSSGTLLRQSSSVVFVSRTPKPTIPSVPRIISAKILNNHQTEMVPELHQTRVVPTLETYYAANPIHDKNMKDLNDLLKKFIDIPLLSNSANNNEPKKHRWVTLEEYRLIAAGTRLKALQYSKLIKLLNRLDAIDKQLVDHEYFRIMNKYQKPALNNNGLNVKKTLDEFGRAIAVGGRKTSSAKVYLVKGNGDIIVNGESLNRRFPRLTDRVKILYPLKVIDGEGKFNLFIKTSGGGISGQTGAIAHGIARALLIMNPLYKARLRKAGCLTRDSRQVERKKPGKVKSRKSPTWVKR